MEAALYPTREHAQFQDTGYIQLCSYRVVTGDEFCNQIGS